MNHSEEILSNLKTDLINSLQSNGKIAGGQTIKQITITTSGNQSQLQIPGYLIEVEKGRGPTSKNPIPGNPPMIQRIIQWCLAKGIPGKAAWAIKKKIDKFGYPGKPGILTQPLGNENIKLRLDQASIKIAEETTKQILNNLNI